MLVSMVRPGPPLSRSWQAGGGPRGFTRAEYHRIAEAGVLAPEERVELLGGTITVMSPVGPRHSGGVNYLIRALMSRLSDRALCSVNGPLVIGEVSEPQPDVLLLKPRDDCYRTRHPVPEDVLLLVEVSEASLELDRGAKCRLYAGAGVSEYWIVDLRHGVLLVHRRPQGDAYSSITEHDRGATVAPLAFPDCELSVAEVLG